jgi:O-antigen ligase/tetratricopeptide (TPR) repeat protein
MDQPSTLPPFGDGQLPTQPVNRQVERGIVICLGLLLVVAVLPFGGVTPGWRLMIAGAVALPTLAARFLAFRPHRLGRGRELLFAAVALVYLGAALGSWLQVGPGVRALLQPGLAVPVDAALAVVGASHRPLALDPWLAHLEWVVALAWLTLVLVTASLCRHRRRVRRLFGTMVAVATAVALLGLAQLATGAESIYWVSGVPAETSMLTASQRRFFGPFVSTNMAGAWLAAMLPLAIALIRERDTTWRALGVVGLVTASLGLWATMSRGGLLAAGVGLGCLVLLAFGRTGRWLVAACGALVGVGVLVVGPRAVVLAVTGWIDPVAARSVEQGWTTLDGGRADLWLDAAKVFLAAPWVGVGHGGFADAYQVFKSATGFAMSTHAHNDGLQLLAEHGLVGGALALCLVAVVVVGFARALAGEGAREATHQLESVAASFSALMVSATMDFPLRAAAIEVLLALVVGVGLGLSAPTSVRQGRIGDAGRAAAVAGRMQGLLAGAAIAGLLLSGFWAADGFGLPTWGRPDARMAAAALAREQGDLALARQLLSEQIVQHPLDREALQLFARVVEAQGDDRLAVDALRAAAGVWPTLPWPWRDLARLEGRRGNPDLARAAWQQALALDLPGGPEVERRMVAEALSAGGKGDDQLVQALGVLPPRAERWLQAATVLEDGGSRDNARILFEEACALDASVEAAYAGTLLRWGEAEAALRRLDNSPATGCRVQLVRAEALQRLNRCEEAAPVVVLATAACSSTSRDLRLVQGRQRICQGDARGIDVLEALLAEDPKFHGARRTVIAAQVERGRSADALRNLVELQAQGALGDSDAALLERLRSGRPLSATEIAPLVVPLAGP